MWLTGSLGGLLRYTANNKGVAILCIHLYMRITEKTYTKTPLIGLYNHNSYNNNNIGWELEMWRERERKKKPKLLSDKRMIFTLTLVYWVGYLSSP